MTNNVDTAAVSADGATYTNPKWMVTIVAGAAGNHEDESHYVKESPSYTGAENCARGGGRGAGLGAQRGAARAVA